MNFVFLSKFLPLFVYPLGLVCILLFIALVIWWKRPAWTPIPVMFAFLILFISSNTLCSSFLVRSLEWKYEYQKELPNAEAIVVLGGGTKWTNDLRLMVHFGEKLDRVVYAAKLYHENKAPLIIATGGKIQWLGSKDSEASEMAIILEQLDVPVSAIIQEPFALNTYENAVNVRKILNQLGINNILLVTSALHMPRSILVFQNQDIQVIPAPTDFFVSENDDFFENSIQINILNSLPNLYSLSQTTKAIKEYLGIVVYSLRGWI